MADFNPFWIFTENLDVWIPLYGACLIAGAILWALGFIVGPLLVAGAVGSAVVIAAWSLVLWVVLP